MQAAATAPAWCPAHHQHHREPPRVGLRGRPGGRPRAMPRRPSSAPPGPYGMALLLTTWQWLARQAQAPCTHALAANITSPHQPAYPVHASGSVLVSRPGSDFMSGEGPLVVIALRSRGLGVQVSPGAPFFTLGHVREHGVGFLQIVAGSFAPEAWVRNHHLEQLPLLSTASGFP